MIDLSGALLNADITTTFDVTRRKQVVNNYGEASAVPEETFRGVAGTVSTASRNDLMRLDDEQRMGRNLSVITTFGLQGPAQIDGTDYQPDTILWNGDTYVVKAVDPYQHFGFVQAIVGSMDHIDQPNEDAG